MGCRLPSIRCGNSWVRTRFCVNARHGRACPRTATRVPGLKRAEPGFTDWIHAPLARFEGSSEPMAGSFPLLVGFAAATVTVISIFVTGWIVWTSRRND
jgi:hypothetical protein